MKLGIGLITADRVEVTRRTLETFAQHTGARTGDRHSGVEVELLHCDDSSLDPQVRRLAEQHGFARITQSGQGRRGGQAMRKIFVNEAARRGCTHVLVLENDWESVRSLPWRAIRVVFQSPDVYCLRLYGEYRERDPVTGVGRRACGRTHYGKGKGTYDPGWRPLILMDRDVLPANPIAECLELGDIHWGAPPNVTRIKEAVWLHEDTHSESQIRKKCAKLTLLTARVVENVFYHIGEDRTPGFEQ